MAPGPRSAWAAAPDRPIVAVTGDGGFAQYMAELTTAVKHGIAHDGPAMVEVITDPNLV